MDARMTGHDQPAAKPLYVTVPTVYISGKPYAGVRYWLVKA